MQILRIKFDDQNEYFIPISVNPVAPINLQRDVPVPLRNNIASSKPGECYQAHHLIPIEVASNSDLMNVMANTANASGLPLMQKEV